MPDIVENAHVEVTAGRNKGDIGYVSDARKAIVQVTTGNDKVFNVRRTSLRVLATPADQDVGQCGCLLCRRNRRNRANREEPKLNFIRIIRFIERMQTLMNRNEITMQQWREIQFEVRQACRVHNIG